MAFLNDGDQVPQYTILSAALGNRIAEQYLSNEFDITACPNNIGHDLVFNATYCQSMLSKMLNSFKDIDLDKLKRCYWYVTNLIVLLEDITPNDTKKITKFIKIMIKWIQLNPIEQQQSNVCELYQLYGSVHFLMSEIHLDLSKEKLTSKSQLTSQIYHYHKGWQYWNDRNVKYSKVVTLKLMDYFYTISKYETNSNILMILGNLYLRAANKLFKKYGDNHGTIAEIFLWKYPTRSPTKWTYYLLASLNFFFPAMTFEGFELSIKCILKAFRMIKQVKKTKQKDLYYNGHKRYIVQAVEILLHCLNYTKKLNHDDVEKYQNFIKYLSPNWLDKATKERIANCYNMLVMEKFFIEHGICGFFKKNDFDFGVSRLIKDQESKHKLNPMCDNIVAVLMRKNGIDFVGNVLLGKYCFYCGEKAVKLKVCSKCCIARYCNRLHQKRHWNREHRTLCEKK
eukprot:49197_1